MRGGKLGISQCLAFFLVIIFTNATASELTRWSETFSQERLDLTHWQPTFDGDCRDCSVSVVNAIEQGDFRLQLLADTLGTQDDSVNFIGARNTHLIDLSKAKRISVNLDWNKQTNGSYLSAALILSPHETKQNPLKTPDWLKIEYVGVPPGQNARMIISLMVRGRARTLYTEGWPDTNRNGRKIALQKIAVVILDQSFFQVWENVQLIYDSKLDELPFRGAYLYLQLSSHSNYSARSVYFDNIRVTGDN
jgi:hypothetical protein